MLTIPQQPSRFWFMLARVFGRKLTPWSYYWRERYWIMEDAPLDEPLTPYPTEITDIVKDKP